MMSWINRLIAVVAAFAAFALAGVVPAAASPKVMFCARFIVGRADSSAYPDLQLPASGTALGSSCVILRRIARGLQTGTYRLPSTGFARAPEWGTPFVVRDVGQEWTCRFQSRGASGPTYAVRCNRGATELSWHVG